MIYGIPNSGWTSPQWNWGYAVGTGHDCAAICRRQYATKQQRIELVQGLVSGQIPSDEDQPGANFEEVKLVLALAWQRGRWDGSDGGRGGYGEVLSAMAQAERYEEGTEKQCAQRFVRDIQQRYELLHPEPGDRTKMKSLLSDDAAIQDVDRARRVASGLVLKSMGFIENGI